MKNFVTVLFAGAVLATAAFAQGTNNWANELNRSKLGRDLTAVSQERAAMKCECGMSDCTMAAKASATARVVAHNDAAERAQIKTGRYPVVEQSGAEIATTATPVHNDADERASLKTGRRSAQVEAPIELASQCVKMGCCKS
jgi:hypothetical protein